MKTILALRLDDPGGLLSSPSVIGRGVLLAAHRAIFTTALEHFGGVEFDGSESGPETPHYCASFDTEETALQAAVSIQQETSQSLQDEHPLARLQCAIAMAHEAVSPKKRLFGLIGPRLDKTPPRRERNADALLNQEDANNNSVVTGGRIVCHGAVYREILLTDMRLLYTWQEAREPTPPKFTLDYLFALIGRAFTAVNPRDDGGRPMECLYDDAQALLNAPFERMFAEEVKKWIGPRARARDDGQENLPYPERPHPKNDLVGLALSGGGMRSAVFSLGAVQALAHYGVLQDVDYLSTVSGGSYFGASLSALWADKLPYDDLRLVPQDDVAQLDATPERFPFAHPRPPADGGLRAVHGNESPALKHVRGNAKLFGRGIGLFDANTWSTTGQFLASMLLLWALFLLPVATLAVLGATGVRIGFEHLRPHFDWANSWWKVIAAIPAIFAVLALVLSAFAWLAGDNVRWHARLRGASFAFAILAAMLFVPEVFGTVTLQHDVTIQNHMRPMWRDHWQVTLATLSPLVLFVLYSSISVIAQAAPKRGATPFPDAVRSVVLPTAAVLTLVLLVSAGVWAFEQVGNPRNLTGTIAGITALGSASVAGISLSKLWDPRLTSNKRFQRAVWQIGLAVGGYIILGLALCGWSWFLWSRSGAHPCWVFGVGSLAAGIITVAMLCHPVSRLILNHLSLNRTYAAMIQNTWVVGAIPPGSPMVRGARWTNVWPRPDITMHTLREKMEKRKAGPSSPYHLVCTALNLPGSTSAKLLDRQSDSFVIAPLYSGSALTRWFPTKDHPGLDDMPLAEAAAVSGAAVSPNMGSHTTRTLSIILTLVNVRLGRWLRNPRPSTNAPLKKILTDSPLALYWKEMFGLASHEDGQIYLSDGGHFDNLGLYELLRRRCKYIIAISADVGPVAQAFDMGNLGVALRLARVDFGVEADLGSLTPVMHDPTTGEVKSFFAAGKITYPGARPGDEGTLIFIKTGIIESELPADLLNYWKGEHPAFPYDSTTDQQYDQPQFESYRQLGYMAARAMWKSPGERAPADTRAWLNVIAEKPAGPAQLSP